MNTKIVCTIGPSTWDENGLRGLINAGMNIARINASFANHDEIIRVKNLVKSIDPNIEVMLDLMGHKIRVAGIEEPVQINDGDEVIINCDQNCEPSEHTFQFKITYPELSNDIAIGDPILIEDGKLQLTVEKKEGPKIFCRVNVGGLLQKNKTLNVPKTHLTFDPLTEKDLNDLKTGVEANVDWVAQSFVRNKEDVAAVKEYTNGTNIKIIAKIESPEGVENFNEILSNVDGIMVARGDLAVEMPLEQVPLLQKRFVKRCNSAGKFVIVATEMMQSMVQNPTPTRAEVSDVANAVIDGANAIMTSAETSTGKYPAKTVEYMKRIAEYTEQNKNS